MPGGKERQKRRAVAGFYDRAYHAVYAYAEHDFGAGAAVFHAKPPYSLNMGRLVEIDVEVELTFTEDTLPGKVKVGNDNDDDQYGTLEMGTDAITGEVFNSEDFDIFGATGAIGGGLIDMNRDGAAGVAIPDVVINFESPTGGTPAGKGKVTVYIDRFAILSVSKG